MAINSSLMNSIAPFPRPRLTPSSRLPILYTGPAVPVTYDPIWRTFTNLTPAQIAAFMSMPETLTQVARDLRHGQVISAAPKITPDMTLAQVQAAYDAARTAVSAPYAKEAAALAAIGKTAHTQADVIAIFKGS